MVENMIIQFGVDTFLFGSKSRFNDICHEIVTQIKGKYPHVKRIYVRAEYQHISDEYKRYLLNDYEDTYYPEQIIGATKSIYVKRNYEMISKSEYCIVYYKQDYPNKKSGTRLAYDCALKNNKTIYNVSE